MKEATKKDLDDLNKRILFSIKIAMQNGDDEKPASFELQQGFLLSYDEAFMVSGVLEFARRYYND